MQINMPLWIIYKFVNVVYEKPVYECTIFVGENLWIKIKTYLFAQGLFHKLNPNGTLIIKAKYE
jgi:hypothetical protein